MWYQALWCCYELGRDMGDNESDPDDTESPAETDHGRSDRRNYQSKLETLLPVLTSRRRRYALYYLQKQEVTDLESLAPYLASIERDVAVSALSDDEIARIESQLTHGDLPALADAQLIDFDRRSGAIRYSAPPPLLEALLRLTAHIDAPEDQLR